MSKLLRLYRKVVPNGALAIGILNVRGGVENQNLNDRCHIFEYISFGSITITMPYHHTFTTLLKPKIKFSCIEVYFSDCVC